VAHFCSITFISGGSLLLYQKQYGVIYQDAGSYRNLFKRCGFSYHRTERVYKSRPSEVELAEFEAEVEKK
jgi:transposase